MVLRGIFINSAMIYSKTVSYRGLTKIVEGVMLKLPYSDGFVQVIELKVPNFIRLFDFQSAVRCNRFI